MIINCSRHASFGAPTAEAALGCGSPQHDHEEAEPSSWEQLCQLDEVVAELSFEDFLWADADADEDTAEALDDKGIVQLVTGMPAESEDAGDMEDAEAPEPTPNQVMGAIDLLRKSAGAHEGSEDALNVFVGYQKSVCHCWRSLCRRRSRVSSLENKFSYLQNVEMSCLVFCFVFMYKRFRHSSETLHTRRCWLMEKML